VSLSLDLLAEATALAAGCRGHFFALVVERDEISLALPEERWRTSPLRARARAESGPLAVMTFDVDLDLEVTGYLAPAAARLAEARIPIVPECGYAKDHLLVPESDRDRALGILQQLVRDCRRREQGCD
jgi:hypothetical protein